MIVMTEEYLYDKWKNEKRIRLRNKTYRVGKMSYGDYFLEPDKDRGELADFNSGTIWPAKIPNTVNYKI